MPYTKEQLRNVGNTLASVYGGSLVKMEIKDKSVIYFCKEHNENFYVELTYKEIADYM